MKTQTLSIQGMSCGHCVMHVRENLSKVATVKEVSIGSATVEFDDTTITTADLARAVESAGYTVVKSE